MRARHPRGPSSLPPSLWRPVACHRTAARSPAADGAAVRAQAERSPDSAGRRRTRIPTHLRRQNARRAGKAIPLLARRKRRAGRRNHAGDGDQEQHVHHLARRRSRRISNSSSSTASRPRATAASTIAASWCRIPSRRRTPSRCAATSSISTAKRYTGNNYEEKGRLFLAVRGQTDASRRRGRPPIVLSTFGDADELAAKSSPTTGTRFISSSAATC